MMRLTINPGNQLATENTIPFCRKTKNNYLCGVFAKDLYLLNREYEYIFMPIQDLYTYKTYRLSNSTDAHNSFMCTVFGETGGDSLFSHLAKTCPKMPKTGSYGVKPNNSNAYSTSCSTKAAITLFMLVLTFINPVLFIIPTALCGYAFSKSTPF